MKKIILASLSSIVLFTACHKEPLIPPTAPAEDKANNQCVVYKYFGTDGDPSCYSDGYTDWKGQSEVIAMKNVLINGTGGAKYSVLDSGYKLYNKKAAAGDPTCQGDPAEYRAMLVWVKYDCRGIAIDTRIMGPFTNNILDSKKAELSAQFKTDGYEIAYSEYQKISDGLSYIVFYVYKPVATNSAQAAVVMALKTAGQLNLVTGNSDRPLRDTLSTATKIYPDLNQSKDVQDAKKILSTMQKIIR